MKVHILLSTYNGEKYLNIQLKSLLKQSYKNFTIHVRDDGSTDNSLNILALWKEQYPDTFHIYSEPNIGVIKSFFSLVELVKPKKGDLFAFCDQDDVWKPNKLQLAIENFQAVEVPENTLYCSKVEYVDEQLNYLYYSPTPKHYGFNNAVIENIATGCTIVFGSNIRKYFLIANPQHMLMHDWWLYLIASQFGTVIFDPTPTLKYRQHNSSVTSTKAYGLSKITKRIMLFLKGLADKKHAGLEALDQASHFINTYEKIPKCQSEVVYRLLDLRKKHVFFKRIRYILKPDVYRIDSVDNFLLKAMIFFGLH